MVNVECYYGIIIRNVSSELFNVYHNVDTCFSNIIVKIRESTIDETNRDK